MSTVCLSEALQYREKFQKKRVRQLTCLVLLGSRKFWSSSVKKKKATSRKHFCKISKTQKSSEKNLKKANPGSYKNNSNNFIYRKQ